MFRERKVYAAKAEPSLLEVRRVDSVKSDPDEQINAMLGINFLQVHFWLFSFFRSAFFFLVR